MWSQIKRKNCQKVVTKGDHNMNEVFIAEEKVSEEDAIKVAGAEI